MATALSTILMMLAHAAGPNPAAPLLSATLVGFLPDGHLVVLETRRGGQSILRRLSHDGAESAIIDRDRPSSPSGWVARRAEALGVRTPTPIERTGDRWRTHGLELELVEQAPLGGRRFVLLSAHRAGHSITVWRMPALARVEVGPLYVAPDAPFLVVTYAQSDRRGLETIDLSRVLGTLMNLEALAELRRGERERAARILEEAIAVAPHAGDAVYNLACIHALMGRTRRAKAELYIALGIDRVRYRALAAGDADLEVLREDPEVRRWLGLEEQD